MKTRRSICAVPMEASEFRRIKWLGLCFFLLLAGVLARVSYYQIIKREPWKSAGDGKSQVTLFSKRGNLYDRNRKALAVDMPCISLAVDPYMFKDSKKSAAKLASILHMDETGLYKSILSNKNKRYLPIKVELNLEEQKALRTMNEQALIFIEERKRERLYRNAGLHILGIVNKLNQGVGGIEQGWDSRLRGEDGWIIMQRDALNGKKYAFVDYPMIKPKNGNHVVTTLDITYQMIIEEELSRAVRKHNAKKGTAVLVEPHTGELLAIACMANPSRQEKTNSDPMFRNGAVQDAFEPGSTFKIVTAAAALEERLTSPGDLIHCENGAYAISSNHTIHDHEKAYAWLTMSQVLEKSSNIGIAKIGKKLGKETLFRYTQNFGFGSRTDIGLPGETGGLIQPFYQWNDFSMAMVSFGEGISVSALQLAMMVSTVANGGELLKPRIVREVLSENGTVIDQTSVEVIRRVISTETAVKLTTILKGVVERGSGSGAIVKGISIAGKTGTAQKSLPGYSGYTPGAVVSSFVGFWPAESPMFVLVVILDEPMHERWGAYSAAPLFSRIVSRISGMPSAKERMDNASKEERSSRTFLFSGYTGEKENTDPAEIKSTLKNDRSGSFPRLEGLSLREALQILADRGIEARVTGSGIVKRQNPEPDKAFEPETVCHLICESP